MKTKVKIFTGALLAGIQAEIEKFVNNSPGIRVISVALSYIERQSGKEKHCTLLIYKESE